MTLDYAMRSTRTLLLIDDRPTRSEMIISALEVHEFQITAFANVSSALEHLQETSEHYDVILLEASLPAANEEPRYTAENLIENIKLLRQRAVLILFAERAPYRLPAIEDTNADIVLKGHETDDPAYLATAAVQAYWHSLTTERLTLDAIVRALEGLRLGDDLAQFINTLLDAFQDLQFDRVRYYRADGGKRWIATAQRGMTDEFVGHVFPIESRLYHNKTQRVKVALYRANDAEGASFEQWLASDQVNEWVAIPLVADGVVIGVISLDNKFSGRRVLTRELVLLQGLGDQIARAIQNYQHVQHMEQMREASTAFLQANSAEAIYEKIIEHAFLVFPTARSVTLYGHAANQFYCKRSRFKDGKLAQQGKEQFHLRSSGTASRIVRLGKITVTDSENKKYTHIQEQTRQGLRRLNVRSYIGLALQAGSDLLGILFINYEKPREFARPEIAAAQAYANQAAFALHQAQRIEREIRRQVELAAIVELLRLNQVETVFQRVVNVARELLRSQFTILYIYDSIRGHLAKEFYFAGDVTYPQSLRDAHQSEVAPFVLQILDSDEPQFIKDVPAIQPGLPPALRAFSRGLPAHSSYRIPLITEREPLGALLIIYDQPKKVDEFEKSLATSLKNLVSIAISNSQRLKREVEQQRQQKAFRQILREAAQLGGIKSIIQKVTEVVWSWMADRGKKALYCDIRMRKGHFLEVISAHDENGELDNFKLKLARLDLRKDAGITIKVFKECRPIVVQDTSDWEDDYHATFKQAGSEVAVPILVDSKAIGVLNLEHVEVRQFTKQDADFLQMLAEQAALEIRRAHRLRNRQAIDAIIRAISALAPDTQEELLETLLKIMFSQFELLSGGTLTVASLRLAIDSEQLGSAIVFPMRDYDNGFRSSIKLAPSTSEDKIGIGGRAFKEKQVQRVDNVAADLDYFACTNSIQSQMSIPLLNHDGSAIGILSLESEQFGAFLEEDVPFVQTSANLIVVALNNFHDRKRRSDAMQIATLSTMWLLWGHEIPRNAKTIYFRAERVHELLKNSRYDDAQKSADIIKKLSQKIYEPMRALRYVEKDLKKIEPVNLSVLLRGRLNASIERNLQGITTILELDEIVGCSVSANHAGLNAILDVIIENSVRAMESMKQKELRVSGARNAKQVVLRIADNGIGVDPEIRDHIFHRQIGLMVGKRDKREGMGIGTYVVGMLVEYYGGTIRLLDNEPSGAVVILKLPYYQSAD